MDDPDEIKELLAHYRKRAIKAAIEAEIAGGIYAKQYVKEAERLLKAKGITAGSKIKIKYSSGDSIFYFEEISADVYYRIHADDIINMRLGITGLNMLKSGAKGKVTTYQTITLKYLVDFVSLYDA